MNDLTADEERALLALDQETIDAIGLAHSGHVTPAEGETFDPGEGDHSQSVILRDYYGRPLTFGDPQDELDGAALRRLREALPEGWDWEVGTGFGLDSPDIPDEHIVVRVSLPGGLLNTPRPLPAAHWDAGWE